MLKVKYLFFVILISFFGEQAFAQPVVNSFSPASGPAGTPVVISGNNFDVVPANNIVFFGNVRATVSIASVTSLTVTVPLGATYSIISVTVNRLVGFSPKAFLSTFECGAALSPVSFASPVNFPTIGISWHVATGDLDGDGKTDLAYGSWLSDSVSVFRNNGTPGNLSLTRTDFFSGSEPDEIVFDDFDGDGKPDMAVVNTGDSANNISIFKNNSTFGNISFEPKFSFGSGLYNGDNISSGDIDGDGKIDIVVTSAYNYFTVLRNTTVNGVISFTAPIFIDIQFMGTAFSGRLLVRDLNADGKADIALVDLSSYKLRILRNTGSPGIISLVQENINNSVVPAPRGIFISDIDGDDKPDIVVPGSNNSNIAIFANTSSAGGVITFMPPLLYSLSPSLAGYETAVADMDGDGKPDIVSCAQTNVAVIKNISVPGNFLFEVKQIYPLQNYASNVSIADMDSDGKPDIVMGAGPNNFSIPQYISILRNRQCDPLTLCPNGSFSLSSDLTGTSYQWQMNTGTGYVNVINGSHYNGATTNSLQLINIPSSWYGYKYHCVVNGNTSTEQKILFVNTWTGSNSTSWEDPLNWSCGSVPDSFTDVIITSGIVVLHSNTIIRSLSVRPGVNFTVVTGNTITVLH